MPLRESRFLEGKSMNSFDSFNVFFLSLKYLQYLYNFHLRKILTF